MQMSLADEEAYYKLNAKIESNNNPKAKAPTSSASGLHQFIRSTWEGLGYDWDDVFDVKLQHEAIRKLTRQNAEVMEKAGCAINFATLYGAHFLGVAGLLRIMRATPNTPIEQVTSVGQRKANPTILKGTVGDFCVWLKHKTGDDVTKRYTNVPSPPDMPIEVHPTVVANKGNAAILAISALIIVVVVVAAAIVLGR